MGFEVIKPMKMEGDQVVPIDVEPSVGFMVGNRNSNGETIVYDPVNDTERSVVQSGSGLMNQIEDGYNSNRIMYTGLKGMKDFRLAMQGYINALEESRKQEKFREDAKELFQ